MAVDCLMNLEELQRGSLTSQPRETKAVAISSHHKKPRYPIRWISYKSRLEEDLERTLQTEGAKELFTNDYFKYLFDQVIQQDARIIRVQVLAFTIYGYLALAYASPEASLSIFGVSVKDYPGVREVLLVLASSTIPIILCLATSRDLLIWTGEKAAFLLTAREIMPIPIAPPQLYAI